MPREFLEGIFGRKPAEHYLLIWALPQKHSFWYKDLALAADSATRLSAQQREVYVGVGLRPKMYGTNHRGGTDDISGIVALWADIDYADDVHKKDNLPPDEAAARGFLLSLPLRPTCIVHSGHGLQAWWVFEQAWVFADATERQAAKELAAQWHTMMRTEANKRGWDVDATHDLARVLRVAGTTNYKSDPVPVRLLEYDWNRRYQVAQVRQLVGHIKVAQFDSAPQKDQTELVLDPDASPPFDKWEALKESDPKIEASWERKREDFKDQSGSSYDMSLATYAAMAEWTDQEIANLLIAARKKHNDDLKLRQDYYRRTIARARDGAAKLQATEAINEIDLHDAEGLSFEDRQKLLAHISASLSVPITRIAKYVASEPTYRLETSVGSIMLGDVDNLIKQPLLRSKIAAATGRYIRKFEGKDWDKLAQGLLNCCEEQEIGDEATDKGAARTWLTQYLIAHRPSYDVRGSSLQSYPYVDAGRVHIFGSSLRKWLQVALGERVTAKGMGAILATFGCEPKVIGVRLEDSKSTTRTVWVLPPEFTPDRPDKQGRDRDG